MSDKVTYMPKKLMPLRKDKRGYPLYSFVSILGLSACVSDELGDEGLHVTTGEGSLETAGIGSYSAPAAADIDNDGDMDMIAGEIDGELIYYKNENGTWVRQWGADNPFATLTSDLEVAFSSPLFADIDGDADQDLLVGINDSRILYFENQNGIWTQRTGDDNPFDAVGDQVAADKEEGEEGSNTDIRFSAPAVGDITGDGALELLVGGNAGLIYYYTRNDSGVWTELTGEDNPFADIDIGSASSPVLIDLDEDGDLDLVIGASDGLLYYFTRDEAGTWGELTDADNPFDGVSAGAEAKPSFFDIDNDGDIDLLLGNSDGVFLTYVNDGNLNWTLEDEVQNVLINTGAGTYAAPVRIDYDNDGYMDTFFGNIEGTILYVAGGDDETENPFEGYDFGEYSVPVFYDFDQDGKDDFFVSNAAGQVFYLQQDAEGNWNQVTEDSNPFTGVSGGTNCKIAFSDTDGDGDIDLVLGNDSGGIYLFRNDGADFTLVEESPFSDIDVGKYSAPVFVDLDDDGDDDLVVGNDAGQFSYFENQNNIWTEKTDADNLFAGIDIGSHSTPSFSQIGGDSTLDLISGNTAGEIMYFVIDVELL